MGGLRKCPLPSSPSSSFQLSLFSVSPSPLLPPPSPWLYWISGVLPLTPHLDSLGQSVLCRVANPVLCALRLPPAAPALRLCNVAVCHVVVPSVSEESPSASESGVLPQDPSAKSVLLLPPKKPAAFPGDHAETPVKQLSLLKQPPALPPKPTARIANHLTGESRCLLGTRSRAFPSRDPFLCFFFFFSGARCTSLARSLCGTFEGFCVCLGTCRCDLGLCVCVQKHAICTCQS